jgi:hypothetical protein
MPDDVEARLQDALDTERGGAEDQAAPVDAEPPAGTETVVELPPRSAEVVPARGSVPRQWVGRPTLAASAAAAAVVLATGAIVIGAINHGHSDSGSASLSEAGAPSNGDVIASEQPAHFFQTSTGREYTLANLQPDVQGLIARSPADTAASPTAASRGAGAAAGAGGTGAAGGTSGGGSSAKSGAGTPGKPKHGSSDATHTTSTAGKTKPTSSPPSTTANGVQSLGLNQQPVPKPLQQLANSRAMILNCAAVLTGSHNAVPLAVDFGRWTNPPLRRVPSAIFVFKNPNPGVVSVYVTSPACDDGTFYTFRVVPFPG